MLVAISGAALHTAVAGGPIGGWAVPYVVAGLVGVLALLVPGPRWLPRWLADGWLLLAVATGVALTLSEWLAPVTGAIAVALIVVVRRSPVVTPIPESTTFVGGTAPRPGPAATVAAPPTRLGPAPAVRPSVSVVMVPWWGRLVVLTAGVVIGGLGVLALAAAVRGDDVPGAARVVATVIGVVFGLLGVGFLLGAVLMRRTRYEFAARGIRRVGNSPGSLGWEDVRAIGLRRHEWIIPDDLTPTPAAVRRRRRTWLLIAPADPNGPASVLRPVDDVDGFACGDVVPEMSFGRTSPAIDALAAALAQVAPDRYVGVLEQGRPRR